MGTRALTVIQDEKGKEIVVMHVGMDGYPTGHGFALKEFLLPFTVQVYDDETPGLVNAEAIINAQKKGSPTAVSMGCLAAQIVAHFKTGPGDFYLCPSETRDKSEEWIYTVYPDEKSPGKLRIKVQGDDASMPTVYDGTISDFDPDGVQEAAQEGIHVVSGKRKSKR